MLECKLRSLILPPLALLFAGLLLAGCSDNDDAPVKTVGPAPVKRQVIEDDSPRIQVSAGSEFAAEFSAALATAQPGTIIELPEGQFALASPLSLDVSDVTIRGQGQDFTVLNFRGQQGGAESLLVTSDHVVLESLAIIDAPADAIKFEGSTGATMRDLRVEWTRGVNASNGAYGLYPLQCQDVLIEDSVVIGASAAGIYLAQSNNIIVRRNRVALNVSGIAIENSGNVDVFDSIAENNSGGIVLFDLPDLSRVGSVTRVFNNVVRNNNTPNFAAEGSVAGLVPAGTGVMLMAYDDVEIFANSIEGNRSGAVAVVSYEFSGLAASDRDYDPFPGGVYVHDNDYSDNAGEPQGLAAEFAAIFSVVDAAFPPIHYDGLREMAMTGVAKAERICVNEADGVPVGYMFSEDGLPALDSRFFACTHPALPEVVLAAPM